MSDDLAEAIYAELVADHTAAAVLYLWQHRKIGASDFVDMRAVLSCVAAAAIDTVLARRQREIARTGPWEAGHHFQEEDGYPGSLVPPRGKP